MACKVTDIEDGGFDALFVEEPPEFLLCVVCHLALRKPVHIIDCGHRFCNTCFQKMKQNSNERGIDLLCPLDREVIDASKVFPDKGIERLVFELKVKCDNEGKGCEWKGDLRSLEPHLNVDCDNELVTCAHDGCNIKKERKELEEHMSNCSKRIIVAADNLKLIKILSQRLDVCEKVVSENYEEQLKCLHKSREEIKGQLDETNKRLEETTNQLKTKEEEFKQYQNNVSQRIDSLEKKYENQLKNKDEDFKKFQNDVSLRFEKLKSYNANLKEELSEKLNEKVDLIVKKSDVENLSKKIGEVVMQVKRGKWFTWKSNVPTLGNAQYSPSYLTDDGYHLKIQFYCNHGGYYYLLPYVFKDELNLKRGSSKKTISSQIGDIKNSKEVDMLNQQSNYFNKSSWTGYYLCGINENDTKPHIKNNCISLHLMIE